MPAQNQGAVDAVYLPWAYRRLGELAELRGRRAEAAQWYGKFVELWRTADPPLDAYVKGAEQRLHHFASANH